MPALPANKNTNAGTRRCNISNFCAKAFNYFLLECDRGGRGGGGGWDGWDSGGGGDGWDGWDGWDADSGGGKLATQPAAT